MVFTDAKTVMIGGKEVKSLTLQNGGVIYEKQEEPTYDDIILKVVGDSITSNSSTPFTYTGTVTIDWGDGNTETYISGALNHTYSTSGTYTVKIKGEITAIQFNDGYVGTALTNVTEVYLPSSVTSIGAYSFHTCPNLTKIVMEGVTSISSSAFMGDTALEEVTFSSNLTYISSQAFYGCSNLQEIILPNGITSVERICQNCTGLKKVSIPSTVTSVNIHAFENCTGIIDYQLYWQSSPIELSDLGVERFPYSNNTVFTIPCGTTQLYVNAGYPSAKLVERDDCVPVASISLTTDKNNIEFGETADLTATCLDDSDTGIPNKIVGFYLVE